MFGPVKSSVAPRSTVRWRTSRTPLMTVCVVVSTPPGPPRIWSALVSRITVWPDRTTTSKLPPGPPVPPKSNDGASTPPPQSLLGFGVTAVRSSSESGPPPPNENSSRISSALTIAPGVDSLTDVRRTRSVMSDCSASPVRSRSPARSTTRSSLPSGRRPRGATRSAAPISVQLSMSLTSLGSGRQGPPAPSWNSKRTRSLERFEGDGSRGWFSCTTTATRESARL